MRAFPPLRSLVVGLIFVLSRTALAQSLRLSDVIGAAKHENLDLKVLQAKLDALSARDSGSTNLPPPMLNLSSMGTDGPFRSGSMREQPSYGISQTIPFPTKIIASGAATSSAFKAGEADKEYEERLVLASVKVAFWDYLHAYQEKQVKEDQLKVLKDHLKRIVRSPVSDTLTNSHILGIKNEISAMESELDDSALKMHRARNVLSVLTGLSAQTLAGHPEEPPPSIVPSVESVRRDNPLLKRAKTEVEKFNADLTLARSAYLPDITVSYNWNSQFHLRPQNQEVMIGLSLPFVFFWQPRAEVREKRAHLIESEALEHKAYRESEAMISNLVEELNVLSRKLARLEKESIPRSENRMELAHSISLTDMPTLMQHREILDDLLRLKLERLQVRSDFEKKIAELEVLKGDQ